MIKELSILDAFKALNEIDDEQVVDKKSKKLINEGVLFDINNKEDMKGAEQLLDASDNKEETELTVIDTNTDSVEHLANKKDYVGQVLLQCRACKGHICRDVKDLKQSETEPNVYNTDIECPACHVTDVGYTILGQVGKFNKDNPNPENTNIDVNAEPKLNKEETNNELPPEEVPEVKEEPALPTAAEVGSSEGSTDVKDDEPLPWDETDAKDDTADMEDTVGNDIDRDDVNYDDTEEKPEEPSKLDKSYDTEDEKKDDDKKEDDKKDESLNEAFSVTSIKDLLNYCTEPENIAAINIIRCDDKNKCDTIFTGNFEGLSENFLNTYIIGFDCGDGSLIIKAEKMGDEKVATVNDFLKDYMGTNIIVQDDEGEVLYSGDPAEILDEVGMMKFVLIEHPTTLNITIKSDVNTAEAKVVEEAVELDPTDNLSSLIENVIKANKLDIHKVNRMTTEEYWLAEDLRNAEELDIFYNRYIFPVHSIELTEQFKKVMNYKTDLDIVNEKYAVKEDKQSLNEIKVDTLKSFIERIKKEFPELVKDTQDQLDKSENKSTDYAILSVFYSKLFTLAYDKWTTEDAGKLFGDDEAMSPMPESVGKQLVSNLFTIKHLKPLYDLGIYDGFTLIQEFEDNPSEELYKTFYNDCVKYGDELFQDKKDLNESLNEEKDFHFTKDGKTYDSYSDYVLKTGKQAEEAEYKEFIYPHIEADYKEYKEQGMSDEQIKDELMDAYGYEDLVDKVMSSPKEEALENDIENFPTELKEDWAAKPEVINELKTKDEFKGLEDKEIGKIINIIAKDIECKPNEVDTTTALDFINDLGWAGFIFEFSNTTGGIPTKLLSKLVDRDPKVLDAIKTYVHDYHGEPIEDFKSSEDYVNYLYDYTTPTYEPSENIKWIEKIYSNPEKAMAELKDLKAIGKDAIKNAIADIRNPQPASAEDKAASDKVKQAIINAFNKESGESGLKEEKVGEHIFEGMESGESGIESGLESGLESGESGINESKNESGKTRLNEDILTDIINSIESGLASLESGSESGCESGKCESGESGIEIDELIVLEAKKKSLANDLKNIRADAKEKAKTEALNEATSLDNPYAKKYAELLNKEIKDGTNPYSVIVSFKDENGDEIEVGKVTQHNDEHMKVTKDILKDHPKAFISAIYPHNLKAFLGESYTVFHDNKELERFDNKDEAIKFAKKEAEGGKANIKVNDDLNNAVIYDGNIDEALFEVPGGKVIDAKDEIDADHKAMEDEETAKIMMDIDKREGDGACTDYIHKVDEDCLDIDEKSLEDILATNLNCQIKAGSGECDECGNMCINGTCEEKPVTVILLLDKCCNESKSNKKYNVSFNNKKCVVEAIIKDNKLTFVK